MAEDDLLLPGPARSDTAQPLASCRARGPLHELLLAATGQDVRHCVSCGNCDGLTAPGMDLTLGEMIRAAAHNDPRVLTCTSLAACEDLLLQPIPCTAGLDLNSILLFLQREAERLESAPSPETPA